MDWTICNRGSIPPPAQIKIQTNTTIDNTKAKRALAESILSGVERLQEEKRVQQNRLQLASQAKHNLDADNALRTQSLYKR